MFTLRVQNVHYRCKGTTKNAHTQVKRGLFSKKIDFSICNTIVNEVSIIVNVRGCFLETKIRSRSELQK